MTTGTDIVEPQGTAYAPTELRRFAAALFREAGLELDKPDVVAEGLLESDLLGHTTHGLALAPRYLKEIASGSMATRGEPEIISDRGGCVCWNGRRLPGVWLATKAIDLAVERAETHGTVTVVVGNSHHIGCLAAYLPRATERGYMAIVSGSDPSQRSVAPFGGTDPVFTPNPIAVGIPTEGDLCCWIQARRSAPITWVRDWSGRTPIPGPVGTRRDRAGDRRPDGPVSRRLDSAGGGAGSWAQGLCVGASRGSLSQGWAGSVGPTSRRAGEGPCISR